MRPVRDRLEDIAHAIRLIESEATLGKAGFDNDEKSQVWMLYHIQLIGESVRKYCRRIIRTEPFDSLAANHRYAQHLGS